MVSINETEPLHPRQERFVALVTSGLPAGRAYEQAGYRSRGNAADVGASKLVRNPKVARALEAEREATLKASRMSREEKLGILESIARNATAPARERISAIKVHNEMTGENTEAPAAPARNDQLEQIKARAREVTSSLVLCYAGRNGRIIGNP
jgi:phage terminase small subunit